MPLRLRVGPASSRMDETLSIVVSGAPPGARIILRARTRDGARLDWESNNTFTAGPDGTVDVARDAPTTGYAGADPTGPLWTMLPVDPKQRVFFTKRRATPLRVTVTASVTLDAGGGASRETTADEATVERTFGDESVVGRPADGDLVGTLFHHDELRPSPAVILLAGSDGGQLDHAAALLASHGYAVLALSYFGLEDLPPTLAHIDLDYFRRAVTWLLDQPEVDGDARLTVIGLSRGGELALLLGSRDDRIGAVVAAAPSSIRQAGLTKNYTDFSQPAWEDGGQPLPFVKGGRYTFRSFLSFARIWLFARPMRQRRDFERGLADAAAADAAIEVERIAGPVMLVAGGDDQLWPSDVYSGRIVERLRDSGFTHEVLRLDYPAAGHFVTFPYGIVSLPPMVSMAPMSRLTIDFGGSPVANAEAAADSWQRLLEFLRRHTRV